MTYDRNRALELLRIGTDETGAAFRDGQEDAIRHVVENRGRLLLVQRAGWGKSFVYFIATKLLREQGAGPALLISPLLALMRNQIDAAKRMGVQATTINSSNTDDWEAITARLNRDEVDVLLISPERLANESFIDTVITQIAGRISILVVDEAHCISDWGHDFRPDYRRIERIQSSLPANISVLATTATVNDRVMGDLQSTLGSSLAVMRGPLGLPSVTLQTIRKPDQAERMAWLADTVPRLMGSGIIYTLTVRDSNRVADWLKLQGIDAHAYNGNIENERRIELEDLLLENRVKCLVATTALGMGYDKPDLGFVIHFQAPGSVVSYYQQVGRAGRAIESAYGVLLNGAEDADINDFFVSSAFPTRQEATEVMRALGQVPAGLSIGEIEDRANVSHGRIDKTLKILSLESPSPLLKSNNKWLLTPHQLSEAFWERVDRLTDLRRSEAAQMREYVELDTDHIRFLIDVMDGKVGEQSPKTALPNLAHETKEQTVLEAISFLNRINIIIGPRKRWPVGGYTQTATIAKDRQAQPGKALCHYGDAGYGQMVKIGKYSDGRYDDQLVEACASLVAEWSPSPPPAWITCIPSTGNATALADFAGRLATKLNLPFKKVLIKNHKAGEQKSMNNSAHKVLNVNRYLEVIADVDQRPVLLIDDIVDSRWTFTVAAWMLQEAGSGPIWPLAIASKGSG